MKKIIVLLLNMLYFSIAYTYSCSGSAFYEINRDYLVESDGIYYQYLYKSTQLTNSKKELIPKIEEKNKLTDVDKNSFEKINKYFGKDNKNLYYKNKLIGESSGFENLAAYYTYKPCTSFEENYIIKNESSVFMNDKKLDLDPKTTEIIHIDTKQNMATGFTIMTLYLQDKTGVYYYSEFLDSMIKILNTPLSNKEYKILTNDSDMKFFVTPYKVFLNGKEIKGIEAKSFRVIKGTDLALSRDKDNYFKDWTMISNEEYQKYKNR